MLQEVFPEERKGRHREYFTVQKQHLGGKGGREEDLYGRADHGSQFCPQVHTCSTSPAKISPFPYQTHTCT